MKLSRLKMLAPIALCTLLGACASTQNQTQIKQQQDESLQRWASCIDRQSEFGNASEVMNRVNVYCEGHKRDLITAYPVHLESQLDSLLTERAQEIASRQGLFPVTLK